MQFIADGPDIPETLLQAHEDGRVIFFCGAGVSYPAGLPGFGGLVDRIYADLGTARTAIEQDAYRRSLFRWLADSPRISAARLTLTNCADSVVIIVLPHSIG